MPEPANEITISEATAAHGINKRTILAAAARGDIPARRIGNLYLLDAEAVRLYAEIHKARRALSDYTDSVRAKASA